MRPLSVDELAEGVRVLYAGVQDDGDVLDPHRRRLGHVLMPRHPGMIREAQNIHHVVVSFRGLEAEPISWGIGFGCDVQTETYPGLLVPDPVEWERANADGWWTKAQ